MRILLILCVCVLSVMTPARGQQMHNHDLKTPDISAFERQFRKYPGFPNLPAQAEHPPEEKRFSWWGYRHAELHKRGVVQELLDKTKGKNCCNGVHSGECRVTKYAEGAGRSMVIIDDLPCEISDTTWTVPLESFDEPGYVIVCAGRTYATGNGRSCPSTYCIGTVGGL